MVRDAITVTRSTLDEIEASPEIDALLAEYAEESANNEIGPASPQIDAYRVMEASGLFHAFAARRGNKLIGFLFLLTPKLPHFGKIVGVTESYFVASAHRKSGAGTKLMTLAEEVARSAEAVGMLVSAPVDGRLDDVMSKSKAYRKTNTMYFRSLV